jgi:polar amino acid transport system substrate-binding protein
MDRRTYLKSAAGATAGIGLAGCLGGGDGTTEGDGTTQGSGETTTEEGDGMTEGSDETTTEGGAATTESGEETTEGSAETETSAGNESMDETGTEGTESTAGNESGNASAGDMELPETVTIGSDIPYRPFEFETTGGELTGFDVDIAAAVFEEQLGIGYEFADTSFDTIIPSLNNGNFRVIMSAMTINDDRDEEVDFSDPYFTAYQTIAVLENSDISAKSDLQGKTVAVQKGTTGAGAAEELKEEFGGDLTIKRYDQIPAAFDALTNNQAVAVINDNTVNAEFVDREGSGARFVEGEGAAANASTGSGNETTSGGSSGAPPYLTLTVEEYGIAFREDDDALLQRVNEALAAIRESGTYEEIYGEYFSG